MSKLIAVALKNVEFGFLRTFLIFVIFVSLVFSIVIVKVKTIQLGYKIEDLRKIHFKKEVLVEKYEEEISYLTRTDRLIDYSKNFGLKLAEPEKVFYVK